MAAEGKPAEAATQQAAPEGEPSALDNSPKKPSWRTALAIAIVVTIVAVAMLMIAWWRNDWDLDAASAIGSAASPLVGLFTVLALGVALWAVRLQELESRRQQNVYQEEIRRQQNVELRSVYTPFMSAFSAYHQAVSDYTDEMIRQIQPRHYREVLQKPCIAAYEQMDRLVQAIILVDTDEKRGQLRFRLGLPITLEPSVDSHDNQKLWLDVILYSLMERTREFVELRNSLFVVFGTPVKERSVEAREFDATSEAEAKVKADAAEKIIAEQLKAELRKRHRWSQDKP